MSAEQPESMRVRSASKLEKFSDFGAARHRSRIPLDPRGKLLGLIVLNMLVLGRGAFVVTVAIGLIAFLLVLDISRGRALLAYSAVFFGSVATVYLLPYLWPSTIEAFVVGIAFWIARFAVTIGLGGWVVATTGPSEMTAALRNLKVPHAIVVPFAVLLRFIPLVIQEMHSIFDAMRLRGVLTGPGSLFLHPMRTTEYILVPLLSAMTRMADELSASALIRGLGRDGERTTIVRLKFRWVDGLLLVVLVAVIALRFTEWELRL